ncbi:MAG TPA: nitroreductase family protein [Gemmatimonadaceae bacterium]|nr:nitroreductase family protein [Gemmatimonadaceae bacterium]
MPEARPGCRRIAPNSHRTNFGNYFDVTIFLYREFIMRISEDRLNTLTEITAVDAALSRRSIRQYAPTAIAEADLRELLRLAGRAPSAYNVQPWRFIVVQDDDLKARLAEAAYGQQQILRAPATIVMFSDMQDALERMPEAMHPDMPADKRAAGVESFRGTFTARSVEEREAWGNAQSNIALGYLLLLAESLGYATSPMLGFDPERVKALLELPAHVRIPALVSIGFAAEEGFRPHRLPADTLVEFR